jgi:hypothetical protein
MTLTAKKMFRGRRGRRVRRGGVVLGVAGAAVIVGALRRRPASADPQPLPSAATVVSGEGLAARTPAADGPLLASAPLDAPGPSVTPPADGGSDVERAERADTMRPDPESEAPPDDEVFVAQQEAAAAAEAAGIGGRVAPDAGDPALDPVYQAGGGEQDGFEEAEAELIENATHGDGRGDPERDAFSPELEADRSTAVYGEDDQIMPSEVEDPEAGTNRPGATGRP